MFTVCCSFSWMIVTLETRRIIRLGNSQWPVNASYVTNELQMDFKSAGITGPTLCDDEYTFATTAVFFLMHPAIHWQAGCDWLSS